jgi:hypothetical protein
MKSETVNKAKYSIGSRERSIGLLIKVKCNVSEMWIGDQEACQMGKVYSTKGDK